MCLLGLFFLQSLPTTIQAFTSSPSSSSLVSSTSALLASGSIPDAVFDTIQQGQIAVVPDFLSSSQVSRLRRDAQNLYTQGHFITDALAGYGKTAGQRDKAQFDPSKDRSVLPAYIPSQQRNGPFVDSNLGDATARHDFATTIIADLRRQVAKGLDRPGLDTPDGPNNHELSYTRFGPGASLKRHNDEHHEELKGVKGWSTPTRRSLSWLIYLNEPDWDATKDGGLLRTYPRIHPPATAVGARQGDLQIGWLTPTATDPVERPVFLDGRRDDTSGHCALYIDAPLDEAAASAGSNTNNSNQRLYLTENFRADPYLFLSTDWVVQHVLIHNPHLGNRFHYVEPPKSLWTEFWDKTLADTSKHNRAGETVVDVPPTGGTLVMFDSVTLPHQVMATLTRERWATSGWFHEAQQEIPWKQQQRNNLHLS
jgi:hypothetical protein